VFDADLTKEESKRAMMKKAGRFHYPFTSE